MLREIFEMRLQHEIDAGEPGEEKSAPHQSWPVGPCMRDKPRKYQSRVSQQAQKTGALKMKGNR